MSIFGQKPEEKQNDIITNYREMLTPQQVSEAKPKWQAIVNVLKNTDTWDKQIHDYMKEQVARKLVERQKDFRF